MENVTELEKAVAVRGICSCELCKYYRREIAVPLPLEEYPFQRLFEMETKEEE